MVLVDEYSMFFLLLPLTLAIGMAIGHYSRVRFLGAQLKEYDRPIIYLSSQWCRIVTEGEYSHLRVWGHLEYIPKRNGGIRRKA